MKENNHPVSFLPGVVLRLGWVVCLSLMLGQAAVAREGLTASVAGTASLSSSEPLSLSRALAYLDQRISDYPTDHEARLLKGLVFFKSGQIEKALAEFNQLLEIAPKFHLAHLIRGDLELASMGPVTDIGQGTVLFDGSVSSNTQLQLLREEAEVRLRSYLAQIDGRKRPRQLLLVDATVKTVLLVDKRMNRLYVFKSGPDGVPVLERDFYVSTGKLIGNKLKKGDLKTPEGVYFVTSWIPDSSLPDKYGIGAFPVNYPNELDRRQGKTGYGIWLHGTDREFYSRPPKDSEGCVVLSNIDLKNLSSEITPGLTPVIIAENVDWLDADRWQLERQSVLDAVENWRSDWESLSVDRYLSHYAENFWSTNNNLTSWSDRKRRVARNKTFQQVRLDNMSVYAFPQAVDGNQIVLVRFQQHYKSNNYSSDIGKRLYLTRPLQSGDGEWKILYEGN